MAELSGVQELQAQTVSTQTSSACGLNKQTKANPHILSSALPEIFLAHGRKHHRAWLVLPVPAAYDSEDSCRNKVRNLRAKLVSKVLTCSWSSLVQTCSNMVGRIGVVCWLMFQLFEIHSVVLNPPSFQMFHSGHSTHPEVVTGSTSRLPVPQRSCIGKQKVCGHIDG